MNGVNPKGVREEYADRLGALMASVAEAAVAGAAVAPVLTHKDNKKWPKWRDMRHVLQHDDSGASIDSSVGILNSSREPTRSCSHSQKFTVFDLVFGENRVDGGGLIPCDAVASQSTWHQQE